MIRGSCLCGAVTYEFQAPTEIFVLCHCNRCKKASGSAFAAGMTVSGLKFLSGEELISCYEAPLLVMPPRYRRDFCSACGSPVPSPTQHPGVYAVSAGSLDDDPGVSPQEHVWVNCEAPWEQGINALPRLTEAQFVLDRVRRHEREGGENMHKLYEFIVERYSGKIEDSEVVAAARKRLSEIGPEESGVRREPDPPG
jgi:hypothetical protein